MIEPYTNLELLHHADAILELAATQTDIEQMRMLILAAQHKLYLLKGILE